MAYFITSIIFSPFIPTDIIIIGNSVNIINKQIFSLILTLIALSKLNIPIPKIPITNIAL